VVFVGLVGVAGRPTRWWWFGLAILGFGLVHGVGLSTRLQDLGLPEHGLLAKVIAFNVGIEIGQLVAVVAMFMLGDVARHYIKSEKAPRYAYLAMMVVGFAAAAVLAAGMVTSASEQETLAAEGTCGIAERPAVYISGGAHPKKDFYEPGEEAPVKDFSHVTGDGFLVVRYAADLPPEQLAELRAFVTGRDGNKVVAGAATAQAGALQASNSAQVMDCKDFELPALKRFVARWKEDPRSSPEHN
jgi:hypothetical protein